MLLRDYPGPRGAPTITYVAISPQEKYFDPTARDVARQNKHTVTVEDRQKVGGGVVMQPLWLPAVPLLALGSLGP